LFFTAASVEEAARGDRDEAGDGGVLVVGVVEGPNDLAEQEEVDPVGAVEGALGDFLPRGPGGGCLRRACEGGGGAVQFLDICRVEAHEFGAGCEGVVFLGDVTLGDGDEGADSADEGVGVFRGADGLVDFFLGGGVIACDGEEEVFGLVAEAEGSRECVAGLHVSGCARCFFGLACFFVLADESVEGEGFVDGDSEQLRGEAAEDIFLSVGRRLPERMGERVEAALVGEDAGGGDLLSLFDELGLGRAIEQRWEEGCIRFSQGSGDTFEGVCGVGR